MLYDEKTDFGIIKFDRQIIGNIVKKIVFEMDGRVLFANVKGRPIKTSENPSVDDFAFLDAVSSNGKTVDIKLYIVVKFGNSIAMAADEIATGLRDLVPKITGLVPDEINVVVKGVISKNFSKRNIEVKSYADDSSK